MADELHVDVIRQAAQSYLEATYPASLAMTVLELRPLASDLGWVVWPQAAAYLRSHDPMDFVPAAALLITPWFTVTPLPTSLPVTEALAAAGLQLAAEPSA